MRPSYAPLWSHPLLCSQPSHAARLRSCRSRYCKDTSSEHSITFAQQSLPSPLCTRTRNGSDRQVSESCEAPGPRMSSCCLHALLPEGREASQAAAHWHVWACTVSKATAGHNGIHMSTYSYWCLQHNEALVVVGGSQAHSLIGCQGLHLQRCRQRSRPRRLSKTPHH